MKRIFLSLIFASFIGGGALFGQGRGALGGDRLPLVPYPKEIKLGEQDYLPGSRIVVKVSSDDEADLFAASTLTEELSQAEVSVKKSGSGIRDFVSVMLFGLLAGTYSSIFITNLIIAYWHKPVKNVASGRPEAKATVTKA